MMAVTLNYLIMCFNSTGLLQAAVAVAPAGATRTAGRPAPARVATGTAACGSWDLAQLLLLLAQQQKQF